MTVAINLLEQKQLIILLKTFILLYFFIGEGVIAGRCVQYAGMKAIKLPFVVNLQKSGQFKSLTVRIGEPSFAVNLKYLLVTLFQVNSTAIVDSNETLQQIKSRLVFGNCKVYYHGPVKTPNDKIYEKVVSYGSDCDNLNKGLDKLDDKFLASMKCRRNGEEKSQWNGTGPIRIMFNGNNIPIITEYNLITDIATSEPFKNSKQKLKLEMHTTTTMINFDPELSVPQRTIDTKTFSRVLYSPVDRSIMVVDGDDILNVYKALACVYDVGLNPILKIIEVAHDCKHL